MRSFTVLVSSLATAAYYAAGETKSYYKHEIFIWTEDA
jgi:carbonic anhydrase